MEKGCRLVTEILTPALYLAAIAVTSVGGFRVYRQKLSSYAVVKDFLLGVYPLIILLLLLEIWRVEFGTPGGMAAYAPLSVGLGLIQAILLCAASVGLYIRPVGSSYRTFLSDLIGSKVHTGLFFAFVAVSAAAFAFVALFKPFTAEDVSLIGGGQSLAAIFPTYYVLLITLMLFFFLLYPTVTMYLAVQKIPNKLLSGSILSLPLGWAGVVIIYVTFESILWVYRVDATGIMYLSNAILFFLVTRNFRSAALLAGVVAPRARSQASNPEAPTLIAGKKPEELEGMAILLEVEPSSEFEGEISRIASAFLSLGKDVFVFTPRGSRVNQAVESLQGVRLYLMTANISYYKAGEKENEVLLSSENPALMLDALAKSVAASSEREAVVLFDSLSDLLLSLGFKESYKFLKAALEVGSAKTVTMFFVMLEGSHEETVENAIKGRFPIILALGSSGSTVIKSPL